MRAVDLIVKKRDGQVLADAEIEWFIQAYTRDEIPDYQAAAFLMAVCLNGMSVQETTTLTLAMAHSGHMLDLSELAEYVVDKHSSGGVGDKTSLVVLPLVASCGVPVAKMSGRGLGLSGGTLDKLESISGFDVQLTEAQLMQQAKDIHLAISGQTRNLAPADGKLYALRDVTGTVPSLPLIASSIMSKKLAAGAQGIVLDVKMGCGAFMHTLEAATELARLMVDIGTEVGRDVVALISDMNQPLGNAVGNALEVKEAIATLKGEGPQDFYEHCLEVAAHMLRLAGQGQRWTTLDGIKSYLTGQIDSGEAFDKFREMVLAQGGDVAMVDDPAKLPTATITETITAERDGSIAQVAADRVAQSAFELGAGRAKKGDQLDLAVGIVVHVAVGDTVKKGQPLATIHANDQSVVPTARGILKKAFNITQQAVEPLPLFYNVIGSD